MVSAIAEKLVADIAALTFPNAFNPWSDLCPIHDLPDAVERRRANLADVIDAVAAASASSLWVARDLGYRGGRRTGLALTDDVNLARYANLLGLPQLRRATRGQPVKERTAAAIWEALEVIGEPVFLWNVFPLHPHAPCDPMSNRAHTRAEAENCEPILREILTVLRPSRVIAIGRDAQLALASRRINALPVRHPSYGGEREFRRGLALAYGLPALASLRQPELDL